MKYFLLHCLLLIGFVTASAQVADVEYGKNRVQYHDDFDQWLYYESQNFITYWYGKARNHGVSTVKLAEQDHDEILDLIEHRINDKIEIIVYSDITDLKQSNIGSDEVFNTVAGQTKIEGSKVFVYFNGDHDHLRKQIRKGVAKVFLNSMFFGSNLQEVVQNSVAGAIPSWFQDGLASYVGSYWDTYDDAQLRNIFLHEKRTNFKKLSGIYPSVVGQSFWYYVGLIYGRSEISNLLYLTRINRSVQEAFLYVFGIPFDDMTDQWEKYFKQRYETETSLFNAPDLENQVAYKRKRKVPVSFLSFSPAGDALAIVDNNIGKTKITIKDLETGEASKIFKFGFKNNVQETDYNYPKVSWLPDGSGMYILYEDRDKIALELRDFENGRLARQFLPERYERVYALAALSEQEVVFTALSEGMIDLFYYTTNNRQSNQITNDIYDDLDISMAEIDGVNGILFSSNRPNTNSQSRSVDTTLRFKNFNLFHLAFEEAGPKLYQITDQKGANYRNPKLFNDGIMFLSEENGIINRKSITISRDSVPMIEYLLKDSSIVTLAPDGELRVEDSLILKRQNIKIIEYHGTETFLTNNLWNIVAYDVSAATSKVAEAFKIKEQYKLILHDDPESEITVGSSLHRQIEEKKAIGEIKSQEELNLKPLVEEVIRSSRTTEDGKKFFQSEFPDMEETDQTEKILESAIQNQVVLHTTISARPESQVDSQPINRLRIVPYRLKFKLHDLSTNMDNNLLFGGLDNYAAFKREFEPPPVGLLMKAIFKDLFEDYVFEGGVRIPTSFNGTEFFLVHDNKKKRLDKQYAVYRKSLSTNIQDNNDPFRTRNTTLLGQFGVRYPLDIYHSLRATATLRQDKTIFLASDLNSLNNPDIEAQRIGLKLEYVFDNAIDIDYNIRSGTRMKLYTEFVKKFAFSFDPISLNLSEGFMTVMGTDTRHYLNFAKHMVWATRFAAATSFGSEQNLYYLGGIDNWLIPKFNQDVRQPSEGNFAYQTISPNLRGFDYNVRNGSTFALINTELRIPFLKYLSRRPIKFAFLRNMQLVGFADVGAAWVGLSPFDDDNPINTEEIRVPPALTIKVNYHRDPVVFGYGVGFRTVLFGYFVRLDYGWGVETREVQKPKLQLALGFDF
ncbi:MAG: hypothetical protein IPL46_08910 [Saprospiraceae bacterium]|nr:hypothetical protein [Saprospiraceae bacterium]